MTHSADRFYADAPHTGGWLIYETPNLIADSANLLYARNAAFDWSLNRVAAGAETYHVVAALADLRRLVEGGYLATLQEQFGGTAGPVPLPGRPPYAGAAELVPPTGQPAKGGIVVTDVVVIHQVGVVALTTAALALSWVQYADAAAAVPTAIPLNAVAIPTAARATPYVTVVPVTNPLTLSADLSGIQAELTFVMANTGTLRVYGIGFHCNFNYD